MPLEEYRKTDAWVLLGDSGAGKTAAFKHEAAVIGGTYLTARDFLALPPKRSRRSTILFIDGLDEMRAGGGDGRNPLDAVRSALARIGRPRFRMSCREADWLGASDQQALIHISPNNEVLTLHLDPLTEEQILTILGAQDVSDPTDFLNNAKERGLDGLLRNPQTLNLLIHTLRGHDWPTSRSETYDLACRQLALEPNLEHRTAKRGKLASVETLLETGGYIAAFLLLGDKGTITPDRLPSKDSALELDRLSPGNELSVNQTLGTRIFEGSGGGLFSFVHRSVAEFLGARYLAHLVEEQGLPFGRVNSLMIGHDGKVVAGLRGLHAWLAVHCPTHRNAVIDTDVLGIVLYSDVRSFGVDEKLRVISRLLSEAKENPAFRWQHWSSSAFGALATPDMEHHFRTLLLGSSRDEPHQMLVEYVLEALSQGETIPALATTLLKVARDDSRWIAIRREAIRAYLHNAPGRLRPLLNILKDIKGGRVVDTNDEIAAVLLETLYPTLISAANVFEHLHAPKGPNFVGHYMRFWSYSLPATTSMSELPILMDDLAKRHSSWTTLKREHWFSRMVGALVALAVNTFGDGVQTERLYDWLAIGLDEYALPILQTDEQSSIRRWFEARPERYIDILAYWLRQCSDSDAFPRSHRACIERFYGATPPQYLGQWYLKQAEAEKDELRGVQLFREAVSTLFAESDNQTLELLYSWVQRHPHFINTWNKLLLCEIPEWHFEHARRKHEYNLREVKQKLDFQKEVRQHLSSIRRGIPSPGLQTLAGIYLGHYIGYSKGTPIQRLQSFLDDDELVAGALDGFRNTLHHPDMPSLDTIAQLYADDKVHVTSLPALAGVMDICEVDSERILAFDPKRLPCILGITYAYGSIDSLYLKLLLQRRPQAVAAALTVFVRTMIRKRKRHIPGVYSLENDDAYGDVVRLAVLPLLADFPKRASNEQLSTLRTLLGAALMRVSDQPFFSLIRRRLKSSRMDVAQRTYWLMCGLIVKERYASELATFIGESKPRAADMEELLRGRFGKNAAIRSISEATLGLLIRLLASQGQPKSQYDLTRSLIDRLSGIPTVAASEELHKLLIDPQLLPWEAYLRHARSAQQTVRREASYRHPSIDQIQHTLLNREPANASDLAALTVDYLTEIARRIRDGNTDTYRQFWNEGRHRRITDPRSESSCRDLLLDKIRERLGRLKIDAQPEGHSADGTRADIRVSYGGATGFNVPIEIKRDEHRDLWAAIHKQLIPRYTRDPGAEGYGIYVVFWCGRHRLPAPPDGSKGPRNPAELKTRLEGLLSPLETRFIKVCVIDVAAPSKPVQRKSGHSTRHTRN